MLLSRKDAANHGRHFAISPNHWLLEEEDADEGPADGGFTRFFRITVLDKDAPRQGPPQLEMAVFTLGTLSVSDFGNLLPVDHAGQTRYLETGYSVAVNLADYSPWIFDNQYAASRQTRTGEFIDACFPTGALPEPYLPTDGREVAAKALDSVAELGKKDLPTIARTVKTTSYYGFLTWVPCPDADFRRLTISVRKGDRTSVLSSGSDSTQDSKASSSSRRSSQDSRRTSLQSSWPSAEDMTKGKKSEAGGAMEAIKEK